MNIFSLSTGKAKKIWLLVFSKSCFKLPKIRFHIFEGGLTGNRYLEIIENILPDLLNDTPLAYNNEIFFQQDSAPAHNSRTIRRYLDETWMGTHGPLPVPPRSSDLLVLDCSVWGYLKNVIYPWRHNNLVELRNATQEAIPELQTRPLPILNALRRIKKVCEKCIEVGGNQFEQFL